MFRLCLFAFLFLVGFSSSSPFDPHPLPGSKDNSTFFEGWFTRVSDVPLGFSFSIIVGSLAFPQSPTLLSQNWIALIIDYKGQVETVQSFFPTVTVTVSDSDLNVTANTDLVSPANFKYTIPDVGTLRIRDSTGSLSFALDTRSPDTERISNDGSVFDGIYIVNITLTDRLPWNPSLPNGDGPEGELAILQSLLPCHYYVDSLGSKAEYSLVKQLHADQKQETQLVQKDTEDIQSLLSSVMSSQSLSLSGSGFGHMETNYGVAFPKAWVWGQAISDNGDHSLLFTNGLFVVGGLTVDTFAVAYRSPSYNVTLSGPKLDSYNRTFDGCKAELLVNAHNLLMTQRLVLSVVTDPSTFSAPLYFPTPSGFSNSPGCVESYSAQARVQVFEKENQVVDFSFNLGVLEFGGEFKCNTTTHQTS